MQISRSLKVSLIIFLVATAIVWMAGGCAKKSRPTEAVPTPVPAYPVYTDPATGITWLVDNSILGAGMDYDTMTARISLLGEGFRAPDLREFFLSFDYENPADVLGHLPLGLTARGDYYRTANRRQDDYTLVVKVDDGDTTKWRAHDIRPLPIAVYGPLAVKNPTFTDNGDGTVHISEADITVLRDHVACFGRLTPPEAIARTALLESGACGLSDGSQPGDWRMLTMRELAIIAGDVGRGGEGTGFHSLPSEVFPERGVWYGSSNGDGRGNYWNLYLTDHPMGFFGDAGPDNPGIAVWVLPVRDAE